jgi:hypothetical protein
MHYRSAALRGALETAKTTAAFPTIKLCIVSPPGPEREDIALACADGGYLTKLRLHAGAASRELAARLIKEIERSAGPGNPRPALFVNDVNLLGHQLQKRIADLHCKLVVAVDEENYPFLDKTLRWRTSGHTIRLPALSERQEDVAPVALSLLSGLPADYTVSGISQEAWNVLLAMKWPDTRTLLSSVQDALAAAQLDHAEQICLRHLPPLVLAASPHGFLDIPFALGWTKRRLEESYILHCVARTNKKTHAARVLGLSKEGLYARLSRLVGKGKHRVMVEGKYQDVPPAPVPTHPGESWDRAGVRSLPTNPRDNQRRREVLALKQLEHEAACARKGVPPESRLFTKDYQEKSE